MHDGRVQNHQLTEASYRVKRRPEDFRKKTNDGPLKMLQVDRHTYETIAYPSSPGSSLGTQLFEAPLRESHEMPRNPIAFKFAAQRQSDQEF